MAAVNASKPPENNTAPMRRLAHRKLVSDYLRTVKHMDDRIGELVDFLDGMDQRNKAREASSVGAITNTAMDRAAAEAARGEIGRDDPAVAVIDRPFESFGSIFDNTIVIYTSDQGYFLGEHDLFGKRFMWEPSIRVPCTIRYPSQIPANLRVVGQVSNVDWAPLLFDLSGTGYDAGTPPYKMHGNSFRKLLTSSRHPPSSVALLSSGAGQISDDFFYRYYDHQPLVANDKDGGSMRPSHLGIRTSDGYKLIMYDGLRCWVPSPFELFDMNVDPHESRNLFAEYSLHNISLVRALQGRLAKLVAVHNDRHISGSYLPRSCGSDYSTLSWKRCVNTDMFV